MEPLGSPSPSHGSFDDVYPANGSGLLSVASSSSLAVVDDLDDATMSDGGGDAAMSDTSSVGIEDRDRPVLISVALDNDAMELLIDDEDSSLPEQALLDLSRRHTVHATLRSASFHGSLPSSQKTESPRPPRHLHHPVARAASLGSSYTPTSTPSSSLFAAGGAVSPSSSQPLTWTDVGSPPGSNPATTNLYWPVSPRTPEPKCMWLHAHFVPAMAKGVARTEPHPQLTAEREDDLMTGHDDTTAVPVPSDSRATQQPRPAPTFPRVEWASNQAACFQDRDGDHLVAVKNQVIGTQVRVLSNAPFQLTTDRANWFLPQGHAPRCRVDVETAYLPHALRVQVFIVGYVDDEQGDRTMDTLEKRTSSHTLQLEHAVYIRIRVLAHAVEGNYDIPVRLFTQPAGFVDETLSWCTSIHVRVADVTLPPPSQWTFHLDLWQHHTSIARGHGAVPLWSDAHFVLIDRYLALLAELGQKCITIVATEMPWAGQMCYNETTYPSALFEHAVLEVYEDAKDGCLAIDFEHFDRLIALAEKHHMASEIEVFGILSIWKDPAHGFGCPADSDSPCAKQSSSPSPTSSTASHRHDHNKELPRDKPLDAWRIRCTNRTTHSVRYLHEIAEIECFIQLFYDHCVSRQLVDRVRICADEPSELSRFYAQMAFLQRLAPHFKVKVALNHLDFLNYAPSQVVDFVPLLPLVCADLATTHQWTRHIHDAKRGRFCWYVCCVPTFPNQFVSSPLAESELVGFLTHFLQLDGFLRWNFCLWPAKPWDDLRWRSPNWKVGDMYFVLPGQDGFPVETLRLEALRFAIQSFELLQLAQAQLPHAEFARLESEIAELLWRSPGHAQWEKYVERGRHAEDLYSLDPMDYERARRLLIDALALATSLDPTHETTGSATNPT